MLTFDSRHFSGMLSTVLLYMVDVDKSRKECEEFVRAQGARELFKDTHFDAQRISGHS